MREYEELNVDIDAHEWDGHTLWDEALEIVCREGCINTWTALFELHYAGSMSLNNTNPLTGERWEESATLCDTTIEGLNWLEDTSDGRAFHKRLEEILEQPVFFRNKDKNV